MRRFALAALGLLTLLTPLAARADDLVLDDTPISYESPQQFALEIKFGLYSPNIDSTTGLKGTPFSDLFVSQYGTNVHQRPPGQLLTSLEFDWQFWHAFGSLGVAASVGIQRRNSHAFQYAGIAGDVSCTVPNCSRSSDTTTLSVMPISLELVYRFDVLALRWHIPLVPYIKAGIGYFLWWIENGSGAVSQMVDLKTKAVTNTGTCGFGGDCGIGGSFGIVLHPGVALLLDALDPSAARTMDNELGINHTYLFFELNYAWVNGFNSSTKLNLSDTAWNTGLAFEF